MKNLSVLKILMQFIAAIWGIVFIVLFPAMMLADPTFNEYVPQYIPLIWLMTALICFVSPCILVKLKYYKIAAGLTLTGAVLILFIHFSINKYAAGSIAWFYMPLLLETLITVLIALKANMGEIRRRRYEKKKRENADAPSILGGTYKSKEENNNKPK
jgi:hypothetical protein